MRVLLWIALSSALALAACRKGGNDPAAGNPCERKSRCAQEPERRELDVHGCKKLLEHAVCGDLVRAHTVCMVSHEVCKNDGTTDWVATTEACRAETDAMDACLAAPPR